MYIETDSIYQHPNYKGADYSEVFEHLGIGLFVLIILLILFKN